MFTPQITEHKRTDQHAYTASTLPAHVAPKRARATVHVQSCRFYEYFVLFSNLSGDFSIQVALGILALIAQYPVFRVLHSTFSGEARSTRYDMVSAV